jgi:cytochrome c
VPPLQLTAAAYVTIARTISRVQQIEYGDASEAPENLPPTREQVSDWEVATRKRTSIGIKVIAMACLTVALAVGAASSAPNARPGEPNPIFGPCSVCHSVGPHASVGVGPPLNGIVGNRWGSHATFAYSAGMIAGRESGRRWDEATLDAWIARPRSVVPDTKMQFPGLADAKARQAIIAYLRNFNEAGEAP